MPGPNRENTTRRSMLRAGLAVVGGAAAIAPALAVGDAAAGNQPAEKPAEKLSPESVHYQPMPKDGEKWGPKCLTCAFFEAPSTCAIISGPVTAQGWCTAWSILHE